MKKFLILGNLLSSYHKGIREHIGNEITFGLTIRTGARYFIMPPNYPTGSESKIFEGKRCERIKGVRWYTNLKYDYISTATLTATYSPDKYQRYINSDAIHIDKRKDIPKDYYGEMGVPVTILDYLSSDGYIHFTNATFKIIQFLYGNDGKYLQLKNKTPFTRIIIQRV